ncbi:MAG: hypothetical protein KA807_06700 [Prolixibacteraceae bacterium]|jgi:hypothetical protein|nr:hypothetical protein [Prolixibacteraceae bacterium]
MEKAEASEVRNKHNETPAMCICHKSFTGNSIYKHSSLSNNRVDGQETAPQFLPYSTPEVKNLHRLSSVLYIAAVYTDKLPMQILLKLE